MGGIVVQHNMAAINALKNVNTNLAGLQKATARLASGFRINCAADDAAGLAISEKMRSQIRGLNQAIRNANDAISLIQTAEGGLNESHSILQRMRELAVQSANGTYTESDRKAIQLEVDALKDEIDRISGATEFNTMKLLDGSLSGYAESTDYGPRYGVLLSANLTADNLEGNTSLEGSTISSSISGVTVQMKDAASGIGGENAEWSADGKTLTLNLVKGQSYTQSQIDSLIKNATKAKSGTQLAAIPEVDFQLKNGVFSFVNETTDGYKTAAGVRATAGGDDSNLEDYLMAGKAHNDGYADTIKFTSNNYGEDTRKLKIATDAAAGKEWVEKTSTSDHESMGVKDGEYTLHLSTGVEYTENDIERLLRKAGMDYDVTLTDAASPDGDKTFFSQTKVAAADAKEFAMGGGAGLGADKAVSSGEGVTFQIGANGSEDQRVTLYIDDMGAGGLGISDVDVSDRESANKSIGIIDNAIEKVSMQRAALGAQHNRLEYTISSLTTAAENLTDAESRISDADMAKEMMNYAKFNILFQAAQAMLAQAIQQPQSVLQLLG